MEGEEIPGSGEDHEGGEAWCRCGTQRVLGSLLASCAEAERVVEDDHVAEDAEYCGCVDIGEGAEKLTRQRQEGKGI